MEKQIKELMRYAYWGADNYLTVLNKLKDMSCEAGDGDAVEEYEQQIEIVTEDLMLFLDLWNFMCNREDIMSN